MTKKGFSLIEVVLSLFILAMISLSLGVATISTRKSSEAAVYQATAMSTVSSYLEQIKSMDYPNILAAVASPSTKPLPTQIDDNTNDPLYLNQGNQKVVPVDVGNTGATAKTMTITITPTVTDLSPTLNMTAVEIILTYTWKADNAKSLQSRAVRAVRSFTPSF